MPRKWELKEIAISDRRPIPLFLLVIKNEPFGCLDDLISKWGNFLLENSYVKAIDSFSKEVSSPYSAGIGFMCSRGWNSFYLIDEIDDLKITGLEKLASPKEIKEQHLPLSPYLVYSLYMYGKRNEFLESQKERKLAFERITKDTKSFYKIVNLAKKMGLNTKKEIPDLINAIIDKYVPKNSWVYYFTSDGKIRKIHPLKEKVLSFETVSCV